MDKIHVYSPCYNEEKMLPYYLRHYETIADKIFIYDNESTDQSAAIIEKHPKAVLKHLPYQKNLPLNRILDKVRNHKWKKSREQTEWVIVCDLDEFLVRPKLHCFLDKCAEQGTTILRAKGFNMYSEEFPQTTGQIYHVVNQGVASVWYDKKAIFNPNKVTTMQFGLGCHHARPKGDVKIGRDRLLNLLHFRYLGVEYTKERVQIGGSRRKLDRAQGMSRHFILSKALKMVKPPNKTKRPPCLEMRLM